MNVFSLKRRIGKILESLLNQNVQASYFHEFNVSKQWGLWPDRTLNPLTANPRRYWSQADEDGILDEIFKRIPQHSSTFVEFGCGDGLQNNSLALISRNWRGGWVDGCALPYEIPKANRSINFQQAWVTVDNVVQLLELATSEILKEPTHLALLSMDLDGNDYHLLEKILKGGIKPDVIVLEYNARFPVGAEWVMPYDAQHSWSGDDYFGASLTSFSKLLSEFGYKLVACSVQGSNAFFIRDPHWSNFLDIESDEAKLYQPPLYYLIHQWAQKASPSTIVEMLKRP